MPLVSIVMLTYNHEKYIRQALDSILMQEVDFEYEIVIGDDASRDNTQKILEEYKIMYPKKFNLILRTENIGATKNAYDVLINCKGDYIAQLEGDDYWIDKEKLKKQIELLKKGDYIAVAHGNQVVDMNGYLIDYSIESNQISVFKMKDLIRTGGLFHTATIVYRNIFINSDDRYRLICEANPLICDFTIYCLLLNQGDILFLPEVMSAYRVNQVDGTNATSLVKRDYINSYIFMLKMYDNISEFFSNKYDFSNLKVLRSVEILCTYYLKRPFSKAELKRYLKCLNYKIKIKAYIITVFRAYRHVIKWSKS